VLTQLLSLAACGVMAAACSAHAANSTTVAATAAPSASRDRLAIVTGDGVLVWSAAAGARRLASPPAGAAAVSELTWSPDGRYLAWEQPQKGSDGVEEVVRVDTRTGAETSWVGGGPQGAIAFNGSHPVSVVSGEPYLEQYEDDGSTAPVALAASPDVAASYGSGFAFITGQAELSSDQAAVLRVEAGQGRISQAGTLPPSGPPSSLNSPYEQITASSDGQWVAFEKGDHTDGCGVGPPSRLYVLNTATGAVTSPQLPLPAASGAVWRFGTMMFSQDGILEVSAYACQATTQRNPFQTLLLEVDRGHARVAARDVVDAQRGPTRQLAEITGDDALTVVDNTYPAVEPSGAQQLKIDGRTVPLPATPTLISWAPENPGT
jgi:hypothetical protein